MLVVSILELFTSFAESLALYVVAGCSGLVVFLPQLPCFACKESVAIS